jgi:outer membrane protein OmpA-like peptidoglycan-associated protein
MSNYNQQIVNLNRAQVITNMLINQGINPARITTVGAPGDNNPQAGMPSQTIQIQLTAPPPPTPAPNGGN